MKNTTKTTNKVIKSSPFRWIAAVAIFALIAGLCFINFSNEDQVYEDHFVAFEDELSEEMDLMLSTRGAGDESYTSLRMIREGMEHYNNKEYDKAIPIFQEYLEKNTEASDYNEIKFYLGVSFLGQGEAERSAKIFEAIAQLEGQRFQEDAKWYLSLAYARTGDTDKARAQLQDLASSEKYGAKAEKILNPTKTKVAFR
ncbi:tetratricopeptide repeat protein [Aureispira anguillae]|uniref:Tetratricopeptide repeat protein n=1 Tax=Aureispira anguillae TaxID=2864201 RepID=A0A915YHY5_9BACT|nr:tetratricopeptide repeat protein [Aureispira anguillae]BDS13380.1 tetratricopeptide repeat protein [Aureispira anguillae]